MKIKLLFISFLFSVTLFAQKNKFYTTAGGDGGIFSYSNASEGGRSYSNIVRFSPVFNFGTSWHYDFNKTFGMFWGWNVRNIGIITERDSIKYKRRVYSLGIPVAFKIGNLNRNSFMYAGYEISFPFLYKEKLFINDDKKSVCETWFSDKTPRVLHSVFIGTHFPNQATIKFQYYLSNFFNQQYAEKQNGIDVRPFQTANANIFFLTFGYDFDLKDVFKKNKSRLRNTD
jgi:hypothetical protein